MHIMPATVYTSLSVPVGSSHISNEAQNAKQNESILTPQRKIFHLQYIKCEVVHEKGTRGGGKKRLFPRSQNHHSKNIESDAMLRISINSYSDIRATHLNPASGLTPSENGAHTHS